MRIGIDVGILREEKRGVGHYLSNLLEQFSEIAQHDTFYLYSPRQIKLTSVPSNNWQYRIGTLPIPGAFWLQTQGKDFIIEDKIEVFLGSCNILPLGLPLNIKKVLAIHDLLAIFYPYTMANYNRFVHKLFFTRSIRNADQIIAMSGAMKRDIINHFGIEDEKIVVIHEGVKEMFYPRDPVEVLALRKRYNLLKPYIIAVGTLEPAKNHVTLLRAFSRLKNDCDLVIIGKRGWKSKNIFSVIEELKLSDRVKILGYLPVDDLPPFYCGAELFVFPSLYEGFGLPLLEAMACGTPVVASNVTSLPELGRDACFYFNPNSVEELVVKIESLLNDESLRKTLSQKGLERVRYFTWRRTAQQTLSVLKGSLK